MRHGLVTVPEVGLDPPLGPRLVREVGAEVVAIGAEATAERLVQAHRGARRSVRTGVHLETALLKELN